MIGGNNSDPKERHGKSEVLIEPETAIFKESV
jgi:hypothetical protein